MIHLQCISPPEWSERFIVRGECSAKTPAIIGLTGISGSGKTTLLRIIAGLEMQGNIVPTRIAFGDMIWQNSLNQHTTHPEITPPPHVPIFIQPEQRPIGMVFQQAELFPTMTVLENIRFALPKVLPKVLPKALPNTLQSAFMQSNSEHALLEEIFAMTHIQEFLQRKPHQLSGGQQKRVALARGLARCGALLLLDEPTIGLDHVSGERLIADVIRYARHKGQTVIVATHDRHLLHDIDTEWRIAHGRVEVHN
jgi:ABC-type sulfate/molybdate transport systems ATPase subunit